MTLPQFIQAHNIHLPSLERVRQRIYVVGRFRESTAGAPPDLFLFTNRPRAELADEFVRHFTVIESVNEVDTPVERVRQLRFDEFVGALFPRIGERVGRSVRKHFPMVEAVIPQAGMPVSSTAVIDRHNWFFRRAVRNCGHPDYAAERTAPPAVPGEMITKPDSPRLPYLTRRDAIRQNGLSIFKEIRVALASFCRFQPRAPEVVDAFSVLLGKCAGEQELPEYAAGAPLPSAFDVQLISFVFDRNDRATFSAADLDFRGTTMAGITPAGRVTFAKVVMAYRDALLGNGARQYSEPTFRLTALDELAELTVKGWAPPAARATADRRPLPDVVREGRLGYNGLRQILGSKVLLSMVLEWVLAGYYSDERVGHIDGHEMNDAQRDAAVEAAILNGRKTLTPDQKAPAVAADQKQLFQELLGEKWERTLGGLPVPVVRPERSEREALTETFISQFELIVRAVLTVDAVAVDQLLASLPDKVKEWVRTVRIEEAWAEVRAALADVTGWKQEADAAKRDEKVRAFLDATEMPVRDLLFPALYQKPVVTAALLRKEFRREVLAVYLAAVLLSPSGQDAFREIGEKRQADLESRVDRTTGHINDQATLLVGLHGDLLRAVANPKLREVLTQGMADISEAVALLDAEAAAGTAARGAGDVSAVVPHRDKTAAGAAPPPSVSEKTAPDEGRARQAATVVVQAEVHKVLAAEAKAAVAPQAPAVPADGGTAPRQDKEEDDEEKETRPAAAGFSGKARATVQKILARVRQEAKPEQPPSREELASRIAADAEKELVTPDEVRGLAKKAKQFSRYLHLIYSRYTEPGQKGNTAFLNRVERLTLTNLMLLFQDEVGLGEQCSNLLQLLSDLVLHVDRENPQAEDLIKRVTLTRYFDNADLKDGGVTELRQVLTVGGVKSLENVVNFVSELRALEYLFRKLDGKAGVEVVVVNATAAEFLAWVTSAHLRPGSHDPGPLQAGLLITAGGVDQWRAAAPPGLVYLTDTAFVDGGKLAWVAGLQNFALQNGALRTLLPPFCISLPVQDEKGGWQSAGQALAAAAAGATAAPVVVVGPSLRLNKSTDGFRTMLPAGYLFCLHYLRPEAEVGLKQESIAAGSADRFRVIGAGGMGLRQSLEQAFWTPAGPNNYYFAVDHYLYLILLLAATASGRLGAPVPRGGPGGVDNLADCFYMNAAVAAVGPYQSSDILKNAVLAGEPLRQSVDDLFGLLPLTGVTLAVGHKDRSSPKPNDVRCTAVAWFNAARTNGMFF